jgi:hypothetical protein
MRGLRLGKSALGRHLALLPRARCLAAEHRLLRVILVVVVVVLLLVVLAVGHGSSNMVVAVW